jgi:hypothetical protein
MIEHALVFLFTPSLEPIEQRAATYLLQTIIDRLIRLDTVTRPTATPPKSTSDDLNHVDRSSHKGVTTKKEIASPSFFS